MRLVVCIIGGAVLCGSFFITLRLIEPEAPPQRLEDQRISHYNDLPTATQNAGLARINEILAQRPMTRTPKDRSRKAAVHGRSAVWPQDTGQENITQIKAVRHNRWTHCCARLPRMIRI